MGCYIRLAFQVPNRARSTAIVQRYHDQLRRWYTQPEASNLNGARVLAISPIRVGAPRVLGVYHEWEHVECDDQNAETVQVRTTVTGSILS